MPPELKGKVEGKLYDDLAKMDLWRNQFKGIRWEDEKGNILFGAIDDCLFDEKTKSFIIIDFKTYGGRRISSNIQYSHELHLLIRSSGEPSNFTFILLAQKFLIYKI